MLALARPFRSASEPRPRKARPDPRKQPPEVLLEGTGALLRAWHSVATERKCFMDLGGHLEAAKAFKWRIAAMSLEISNVDVLSSALTFEAGSREAGGGAWAVA